MRFPAPACTWTITLALTATGRCGQEPPGATGATRVTIVGVVHAPGQFERPDASPAYVRACLEALDPDAIGVESCPEWFARGRFYRSTYEARLATAWGRARDIPVAGIDWIGDTSGFDAERRRRARVREERELLDAASIDPARYDYGLARWSDARTADDAPGESFLTLNGAAWGARQLEWIDAQKHQPGSAGAYMDERDGHIADAIEALARRHPGGHVVVVIGAMHKLDLERRLRGRGVAVGGLGAVAEVVPLSRPDAMEHLLEPADAAAILCGGLDAGTSALAPQRAERLLERLEAGDGAPPPAATWRRYFRARLDQLAGHDEPARGGFRALAVSGADVAFPHRGHEWRTHLSVRQAAMLELGRLADLAGRRDEAIASYRRLLESIPRPHYAEQYHADFEPIATARNAVRALVHRPWQRREETAARPAAAAAPAAPAAPGASDVDAAMARMKTAFDELRAGDHDAAARIAGAELERTPRLPRVRCEALYVLAMARAKLGDRDGAREALAELDEAAGALPDHWVHRERHWIVKALGDAAR